jgi:hypothetical protein
MQQFRCILQFQEESYNWQTPQNVQSTNGTNEEEGRILKESIIGNRKVE